MENGELLKIKLERACRFGQKFEDFSEKELGWLVGYLFEIIKKLPGESKEKHFLTSYVSRLKDMQFERCGAIFKGVSNDYSAIIKPADINKIINWASFIQRTNS